MHRNRNRFLGFALICMLLCGAVAFATEADTDDSFAALAGAQPAPAAEPAATAPPQGVLVAAMETVSPQEMAAANNGGSEWTYSIPADLLLSDTEFLRLVNREFLLDSKYKPDDLVDVSVRKSKAIEIKLRKEVDEALAVMFEDAETQGITLYALSGFRSYQTQATMFENVGGDSTLVQAPGASDHQTGLGVDIISKKVIGQNLKSSFEAEPEAKWMAEHCWEYGFVIRYPKGKEEVTGITFEPWHLRYVGSIDVAAYLTHNGLTLEEFTAEWESEMMRYDSAFVPTSAALGS